jgi:hypothetical protein
MMAATSRWAPVRPLPEKPDHKPVSELLVELRVQQLAEQRGT